MPAALEHILAQENGKDRCVQAVRELSQAFALAVPHEEAIRIRDDVAFFQTVRTALAKRAAVEARPEEDLDHAVRQIISRAVASEGVIDIFAAAGLDKPDISILSDEFLAEVQGTLSDNYQCRVWWWLSLALYVKGMRTPWLLDNLADDTVFVGLGFGIDSNAQRGDHIVLGCSHIYSARGEGLQYRLSKIENPIIRRGNPFMSADDARRVGETIRQLFFDARVKLPERVVIHKRTPFSREEREGLRDGLSGVACIDMLEIQIDRALRYMASVQKADGTSDEDNFLVRRGTAMKLDDHSALLWVHGATTALNPRLKYFQGKRRIPAPLIVRRHAGRTSLQELAGEILGLSKMNWNTFDLYTKLPATLSSSGEIAKIGSLLQRFGTESYDYRLFM